MVLRALERKIEALFEGVFGRAFRTNVQPVELARKLAKEMDDHKTVSVSRVYVPNEYTVYLSPSDREQFEGYETSLVAELEEYLGEHAKRENYGLLLGRSRECDIQIEDPNVSRRHAELRQEGSTYWLVDLDSTNGVEVNGRRVKRAKLETGDTFTVGSTDIAFSTERE